MPPWLQIVLLIVLLPIAFIAAQYLLAYLLYLAHELKL